jgi:hypothetical protein
VVRSGLRLPERWPCRFSIFPHVASFPAVPPTYLARFAVWTAFPPSGYYRASVAMRPPPGGSNLLGDLAFPIMQRIETGLGRQLIP